MWPIPYIKCAPLGMLNGTVRRYSMSCSDLTLDSVPPPLSPIFTKIRLPQLKQSANELLLISDSIANSVNRPQPQTNLELQKGKLWPKRKVSANNISVKPAPPSLFPISGKMRLLRLEHNTNKFSFISGGVANLISRHQPQINLELQQKRLCLKKKRSCS